MAAARDRCGLAPEERLDAGDAYRLFTDWSAAAIGESRSIEPGATADLVVLDRHPVDTPPEGLREAKVLATYVEGDRVDVGSVDRTWPG
jgi:hypothetical protein